MNPLRITAENYRSFVTLDLQLPSGTVAIVGANGAGKSSIVNVVDLALFGPPSRNLGDYLSQDALEEALVLTLEFEHRGELYRVRRSYSPKGRGQTKLDFEIEGPDWHVEPDEHGDPMQVQSPPEWEPLTRETAAATQALIEETLGLSRETFRASAFLAQGDGAAFTEAQPRERKQILAEVLGLSIWDKLLERAKADRQQIEAKSEFARQAIGAAGEELERRPFLESRKADLAIEEGDLLADIARFEESRVDAAKQLTGAREAAAELKGAREALAARESELARVTKRVAEIEAQERLAGDLRSEGQRAAELALKVPGLEGELAGARGQLEQSRERDRLLKQFDQVSSENLKIEEALGIATAKLKAIRSGELKHCDRCHQDLPDEAREHAIESLGREIDDLNEKHNAALVRRTEVLEQIDAIAIPDVLLNPAEIEKELAAARAAEARVREIEARLERLDELKAEREVHQRDLPDLERDVDDRRRFVSELSDGQPDVGQLEQNLAETELRLRGARSQLEENQRNVARVDAELERLTGLAEKVETERAALLKLQAELDVVLLAERAYGRDGIPALIVENAAIPQIEVEANRILAELGTSFTVELRTQRELKDGSGVREALDIVVCGPAGARPYETFSGGERTRLNLSLRIALARLLAHRRGAEVRMLVIDEPEFLDEAGVARLAEVLRGLSADFSRIFLISHQPALREAFDEVLTVVKDGDRSRVEEARTVLAGVTA